MVPNRKATVEEYLAFEATSPEKHAFVNGEIVAMAGGTLAHARVSGTLSGMLYREIPPGRCRVHSADQRVHVESTGLYVYPDVTVVCGPPRSAPGDRTSLVNPKVVFEVVSPSTEADDRGWKFQHYKQIPGLAAYVLVAPKTRHVEVATPLDDGRWAIAEFHRGDAPIEALGCALNLDELFAGLDEIPEADR